MNAQRKWIRVNRSRRCPVCDHCDYCTLALDGKGARCMRVESGRSLASGGWYHKLDGSPLPEPAQREPKRVKDVTALARKMFADRLASDKREQLAKILGVKSSALESLRVGIGWDYNGTEFASFPSRGMEGNVIGIVRRYGDGVKKTFPGTSNAGIFAPEGWHLLPGPVLIVEGGSDTAALHGAGFPSLGRPSNIGGAKILAQHLRKAQGRSVLVIGENDTKPEKRGKLPTCQADCQGCNWCWPGRFGAAKVCEELRRSGIRASWAVPPEKFKDVRAWSNSVLNFRGMFIDWMRSI